MLGSSMQQGPCERAWASSHFTHMAIKDISNFCNFIYQMNQKDSRTIAKPGHLWRLLSCSLQCRLTIRSCKCTFLYQVTILHLVTVEVWGEENLVREFQVSLLPSPATPTLHCQVLNTKIGPLQLSHHM